MGFFFDNHVKTLYGFTKKDLTMIKLLKVNVNYNKNSIIIVKELL